MPTEGRDWFSTYLAFLFWVTQMMSTQQQRMKDG